MGSQTYSTPGTYTFIVPDGVVGITIQAWGGGGAGGGVGGGTDKAGGGASSGQFTEASFNVVPGQKLTVVVGSGGTGVSNGNGNNGGTTSVTSAVGNWLAIYAYGGIGGTATHPRVPVAQWPTPRPTTTPRAVGSSSPTTAASEGTRPTPARRPLPRVLVGGVPAHRVTAATHRAAQQVQRVPDRQPVQLVQLVSRLEPPTATAAHSLGVVVRVRGPDRVVGLRPAAPAATARSSSAGQAQRQRGPARVTSG